MLPKFVCAWDYIQEAAESVPLHADSIGRHSVCALCGAALWLAALAAPSAASPASRQAGQAVEGAQHGATSAQVHSYVQSAMILSITQSEAQLQVQGQQHRVYSQYAIGCPGRSKTQLD